ncbi:MAG: PHP domain-containing protein [Slackia sp.]|nr:PHP domain-containing protein [Slackia sp.]
MSAATLSDVFEACGMLERGHAFCADLHVHSTVSDGSEPIASIASEAARRGLSHVALTNHDTTRGLAEAVAAGERAGVGVVGGVEISAYDFARARKVHIIGLGLREGSPAVEGLCSDTILRRNANSRWQLDRLLDAGYDVDLARVERFAHASTALYKQHIMAGLTDEPYASAAYAALYRGLFKGAGICARDIAYVDARDAVAAIVEDGGRAVLAHPGQLDSWDFIPELVSCGLAGIEVFHPDHADADCRRASEAASSHGLFRTGGSDFHGAFGSSPHVGFRWVEG